MGSISETRIAQLAESVANNTRKLDQYLKSKNLPTPSFDADGPVDFGIAATDEDVEEARVKAIEAAMELADLLKGPMTLLRPIGLNGTSLQAISRLDVASKVPIGGEVSFIELAKQCDIYEPDLRRILRFAMVHHRIFREPTPGFVSHSAASRRLAEEQTVRDGLWLLGDMFTDSSAKTVDALLQFKSQEPQHTGAALAAGRGRGVYDDLAAQPHLAKRFASAMSSFALYSSRPSTGPRTRFLEKYPWESFGKATVVDIGGSRGVDMIRLATKFSQLNCIVQDLPQMIVGAEAGIPVPLKDRVRFMTYNFFTPQTTKGDIYVIKQCLHNWPDHYCVNILKNQIPALKNGARIVVSDSVVPEPGTMTEMAERTVRAFDLMMMTNTNGREREKADWARIFKEADERFELTRMETFGKAADFAPSNGIVEAIWRG